MEVPWPKLVLCWPWPIPTASPSSAAGADATGSPAVAAPTSTKPIRWRPAEFLVAAEMEGDAREGRIYLAAPLTAADIENLFPQGIADVTATEWDARSESVAARQQRRFGAIVLADRPHGKPDGEAVAAAMVLGVRQMGLACLPWTDDIQAWRQRVAFLGRVRPEDGWPDLSDEHLLATLEDWLAPMLPGISRRSHLARLDLAGALRALVPWPLQRRLDELAPVQLEVASGARIAVDYGPAEGPVLAMQLQHLFGQLDTPEGCRWPRRRHPAPAVAGAAADRRDQGSPQLLGQCLSGSAQGNARPLSQAQLAGRPPQRRTGGAAAAII